MARRRVKVAQFRGDDIELEFADGNIYPVRGDLIVDVILHMAQLEEQSGEIVEGEDSPEFMRWLADAKALVVTLVREKNPEAELPPLSVQEIMGIFAALAGADGDTVGEAIRETLSAGAAQPGDDDYEPPDTNGSGDDGPLARPRRSSGRSSSSASPTTGSRDGGEPVRGRSSKSSSRSRTRTPAATGTS